MASKNEDAQKRLLAQITGVKDSVLVRMYESKELSREDSATCMNIIREIPIFPSLIAYVFTHLKTCSQDGKLSAELQKKIETWKRWDNFSFVTKYPSIKDELLGLLRQTTGHRHGSNHAGITLSGSRIPESDINVIRYLAGGTILDLKPFETSFQPKEEEAQNLLDLLQALSEDPQTPSSLKTHFRYSLIRISRKTGCYPSCRLLKDLVVSSVPIGHGAFADVHTGTVKGRSVAIKVPRLYRKTDITDFLKGFAREFVVWSQLNHPNVLPFYGIHRMDEIRICFVSPLMENGNLMEFLKRELSVNREHLMLDVVSGLEYLHLNKPHIIHGDLKAANVLITNTKRACLADFGLAAAYDSQMKVAPSSAPRSPGSIRYMAPELFDDESDEPYRRTTTMSDVYALACVIYETYTGTYPFDDIKSESMVSDAVRKGRRPSRPAGVPLDDDLWKMTQNCWAAKPETRLTVDKIKGQLMNRQKGTYQALRISNDDSSFLAECTKNSSDHPFSFIVPA